jgi:alpha-galactosidase
MESTQRDRDFRKGFAIMNFPHRLNLRHSSMSVLFLVCLLGIFQTASARDLEIRSAHVLIQVNNQMQRQIQWLDNQGGSIVAFDPSVQDGVEVLGRGITGFRIEPEKTVQKRIQDPEFGPAWEILLTGIGEDENTGIRLERQTRILLPEKFPDVVLLQSHYWNRGTRSVDLEKVYSARLLLDRHLAEPDSPRFAFASFQGGAYRWGDEYALIWLKPGFFQTNFQGAEDVRGPEGVGGGMPFVDVWCPTMGVAIAHLEKTPQWLSLPVRVRPDERVEIAIQESPQARLGQKQRLEPGEDYSTVLSAILFHRLDYFDPLRVYGQLLRARGLAIRETSPPLAYEPYWKSWGFQKDFTLEKILALLPELKSMEIRTANLDDGWYDYMGDWQLARSPGKFPRGDRDMVEFVGKLHQEGFKSSLWWYPFGVSPESRLAKEHPELLVQDQHGQFPLDPSDLYQLCPAYEPALQHIRGVLNRILVDWGYDGVYTDFQGLSAVPACFNPAHRHRTPLDSFQSTPRVFQLIDDTLKKLEKSPHEVCICAMPHSPYAMPYYEVANASDPINAWQVRSRVKGEKAIHGGTFAVGDCYQVPIQEWYGSSVPESFESAMGTGAQLTTFYTQLDSRQRELWRRWFQEYRQLGLAWGESRNLYDIAFDKPEIHVVQKGKETYYGIFAEAWSARRPITLRGLDKNLAYRVYDYKSRIDLGTLHGSDPRLKRGFKESLLLRVTPVEGK